MRVDICLPAHNEETLLESSCLRLLDFCRAQAFAFEWRIVILVNGSTDSTELIAKKLADAVPEITVMVLNTKGKGNAIITYWSESTADILCFMDSDLATDINYLPELLKPLVNGTKKLFVIGSRHLPSSLVTRSWRREWASRVYNFLSQLFLKHAVSDLQCGFKAMSVDLFFLLRPYITDRGWFFDTELIGWTKQLGGTIMEIPVSWKETRHGRPSNINLFRDSWYFIAALAHLRKKLRAFKKNTMK